MFTPHTYPVALLMMLVSMLCWGSWANTQKIDKAWRLELFYWDYMWGILVCALLFGLTLGRTNPAAPVSFFQNLDRASTRSVVEAFVGGMVFNLGNLLLVAAISVAGMAVAFPLGAGLALVIGAVLNYAVSPASNPLLLFGGILLICVAIAANAMAYRGMSKGAKAGAQGIVLSLLCGVVIGLFYPFVARALIGENHLGPYTVYFVFALGALASNFPLNYAFMRRPVSGSRLSIGDYFRGRPGAQPGEFSVVSSGEPGPSAVLLRPPRPWWGRQPRFRSVRAILWLPRSGAYSCGKSFAAPPLRYGACSRSCSLFSFWAWSPYR
jgi:glucose uptake protein